MIEKTAQLINNVQPSILKFEIKEQFVQLCNLYPTLEKNSRKTIDAYGNLFFNEKKFRVILEHRTVLSPSRFGKLNDKISSIPDLVIVCSEYITPAAKEQLELEGISYVDGQGNIFIINSDIFLKCQACKHKIDTTKKFNKDLSKKQSILIQWLLDNDFEEMSMREIKSYTNVSLGTVSNTLNSLIKKELLKKHNRHYKLLNKQKLEDYLVGN